jgi:hypothetical protein
MWPSFSYLSRERVRKDNRRVEAKRKYGGEEKDTLFLVVRRFPGNARSSF